MKVPFFDLKRLYRLTEHDVDREIRHVLESGHYILGNACKKFEETLKTSLVGEKEGYAIGCNSGTDALILPLLALNVGPGDEVIAVSHTAIPTITAIRVTGATPVFCDIDPETWVMDVNEVPKLLTSKTKAVIAVHLYGNMVDIPALRTKLDQAGRKDIRIIEDCAQAQGSTLKLADGRIAQAGTIADFGAYSFYPTKNIGALGDAGAIFTPYAAMAEKIQMLRFYGQKDRYNALIDRGLNSRLDEIQAAILDSRMKYLNKWAQKKSEMVERYRRDLQHLTFQKVTENCTPNWHLAVVKLNSKVNRDEVIKKLETEGVNALIHYPIPTHRQKAFERHSHGALKHTEGLVPHILSLPMNVAMLPEELEHVIASVKKVLD